MLYLEMLNGLVTKLVFFHQTMISKNDKPRQRWQIKPKIKSKGEKSWIMKGMVWNDLCVPTEQNILTSSKDRPFRYNEFDGGDIQMTISARGIPFLLVSNILPGIIGFFVENKDLG